MTEKFEIYYLDNEQDLCDIVEEYGEIANIAVSTFTNHENAIAACADTEPDILFIDYRLQGITGDKVAQRISDAVTKVLVTGELQPPTLAGFSSVLAKPFDLKDFLEIITKYREAKF